MTPRPWRPHWASPRDASWWDHPDTRTPKRYHIDNGHGFAKCSGHPLVENIGQPLVQVDPHQQCKRNGCRAHWPPLTG